MNPDAANLRLELRAKNAPLWHLIFDSGETVASFCRKFGLRQTEVGQLLNLRASPYRKRSGRGQAQQTAEPTRLAERLALIAGWLVEDLFPPDLYALDLVRPLIAEVPVSAIRRLGAARHLALPPTQDDGLVRAELQKAFAILLDTLTPREAKVIRLRYGFDDEGPVSPAEIGRRFGVCAARIYQIEATALRKLRHPARTRRLRRIAPVKEHRWRRDVPPPPPSEPPAPTDEELARLHRAAELGQIHQKEYEAAHRAAINAASTEWLETYLSRVDPEPPQ